MIRRCFLGLCFCVLLVVSSCSAALAADPHSAGSTGPPNQTCLSETAPNTPGNASTSPGSPFNEPGSGGNPDNPGGIGGQHYAPNAQYDVACFQVSQSHP
jgi:hypothetical protein